MLLPLTLPVRSKTCWAPPASCARGRAGCAKRRSLVALTRPVAGAVWPAGAARLVTVRAGALVAGRVVSEAATFGAASGFGSASSLAICWGVTDCGLGDG